MKQIIKNKCLLLGLCILLNACKKNEIEEKNNFFRSEVYESMLENSLNSSLESILLKKQEVEKVLKSKIDRRKIIISAVGDCTLGTDTNFGMTGSFTDVLNANNRDFSYFFDGVYEVLANDDLTIANLETTFTNASENYRVDKKFNFKGDGDFTTILTEGSVEAVNLANNHTYDYGEKGYYDTQSNLEIADIPYFGYENYTLIEKNGIKIGLVGLTGWHEETTKNNTKVAIEYLQKNNADLIIISYHWGIEREYNQNSTQENIAHYAIDNGADLVIGHHPHVLQGIEEYNGKYIVYSLGNFVFGGNKNPSDKDTMIFQETFYYENEILINTSINIIPCSLSSKKEANDYHPIILEGEEQERVLKKIKNSSTNLNYID